jgi:hypothetical protein
MPLTRAQRNAAAGGQEGDAPAEQASSQAPARRAFGAVDNQRKGKRKAAAKKEPARDVRRPRPEPFKKPLPSPREPRPQKPSVDPRPRPPR